MPRPKPLAIAPNPAMPFTEIDIDGKIYKMCFDFRALGIAEAELRRRGHAVVILEILPALNQIENFTKLFAASLHAYHPEIGFEQGCAMVGFHNAYAIVKAVGDALEAAYPEPKPGPPQRRPL